MVQYAVNMNNPPSLTPDVVDCLNNSLSKVGISILRELYRSPQMQQKDLAASIHTSTTSLSNILSRLEDIRPQLLASERVGRSKYYSLTEIASLYVAQVILPQTNSKIHKFSSLTQKDSLVYETLTILYQFQSAAGSDWDLLLDNMLVSKSGENSLGGMAAPKEDELFTLYMDFIDKMKHLKISNQDHSIREVYDILSQPILTKRIEAHLAKELTGYYNLKPLLGLEKQNLRKAIRLVDNIFIEISPEVFLTSNVYEPHDDTILPEEQYNKILREINSMKNDFSNPKYNESKDLILEHWMAKYYLDSYFLEYIAEKCLNLRRNRSKMA